MRILHTMLRVGDLQRSIQFYQDVLGMRLLRTSENPEYKYSLAFLGYDDEDKASVLELTYNWGVDKYDLGNAYGHIAIGVDDIYATCEAVRKAGGNVTREPGPGERRQNRDRFRRRSRRVQNRIHRKSKRTSRLRQLNLLCKVRLKKATFFNVDYER